MSTPDGEKIQQKGGSAAKAPVAMPDRARPQADGGRPLPNGVPPLRKGESAPNRPLERGVAAILLVDLLALLVVFASGPAAYLWLDQSHPAPLVASGGPEVASSATLAPHPSPVAGGSGSGASPGAGSSGAASASPSPKRVYGNGTWAPADSMPGARWGAASVSLHDGRVMVVGGEAGGSSYDAVATSTIFDPATGHWSVVTSMLQPRAFAMAVTLADGSVLVAGGLRNGQPLDTAERYLPEAGTWVAAGRLNLPRAQGGLTLLRDGRVLATGGGIEGSPAWSSTASAELFDPKSGAWSIAPPMSVARTAHTAVLLSDGEVLVAGGATTYYGESGSVTATAEIYNPATNAWRSAGRMSHPRYKHGAALLADGRVLVAGGWYSTSNSDPSHETAEVYDPGANRWAVAAPMTSARAEYGLAGLPDGRILVTGGVDPGYKVQAGSELYDPASGTWQATGKLAVATMWSAIQTLPDGRVLIAGGALDAVGSRLTAVCEIYSPPPR